MNLEPLSPKPSTLNPVVDAADSIASTATDSDAAEKTAAAATTATSDWPGSAEKATADQLDATAAAAADAAATATADDTSKRQLPSATFRAPSRSSQRDELPQSPRIDPLADRGRKADYVFTFGGDKGSGDVIGGHRDGDDLIGRDREDDVLIVGDQDGGGWVMRGTESGSRKTTAYQKESQS